MFLIVLATRIVHPLTVMVNIHCMVQCILICLQGYIVSFLVENILLHLIECTYKIFENINTTVIIKLQMLDVHF